MRQVYVYELPEHYNHGLKKSQRRCIDDQYGTEIRIHEELLVSPLRTLDGDEAEFFYVPIYGEVADRTKPSVNRPLRFVKAGREHPDRRLNSFEP
jgi:hypothetical protein